MNSSKEKRYIVGGTRPWNRSLFEDHIRTLPGKWDFAASQEEMEGLLKLAPNPRYIFFLHWSTRVPEVLLKSYECVCFHMADVPFGRGGSPLQNLIQLGIRETKLTALRMVEELDAGPTYLKRPMSLEGGAEEIYLRAGHISSEIIAEIIRDETLPKPQLGEAVVFKRRKPAESKIPENIKDFVGLHDFIRMLDAAGYPHAFIEYGGFRFEFTRAALYGDRVDADVTITRVGERLSPQ